jgi:hypothetical protein
MIVSVRLRYLVRSAGLVAMALALVQCGGRGTNPNFGATPGTLVSYQRLQDFSTINLDTVLDYIEYESGYSLDVDSDVTLYKVVYNTTDGDGNVVQATGAVAVPDTPGDDLSLVSYQHSTATQRSNVPSGNNDEGWAVLAIFAASGNYVVSMPDYLGLGGMSGLHPYLVGELEATASLDMIRAAQALCDELSVELGSKTFLTGYSQGGHSTMALAELIQSTPNPPVSVAGVAPGAGPYDLSSVQLNFAFNNPGPDTPTFLSYVILAYREQYGILSDLSQVFQSPWDTQTPPLFSGSLDLDQIAAILPSSPSDLFTAAFVNDVFHGTGNPFVGRLAENDNWEWVPTVPMMLLHASSDNIVSYQNSVVAYNYMNARGANVQLVDLGDNIDHLGGFYYAVPRARLWFDQLAGYGD